MKKRHYLGNLIFLGIMLMLLPIFLKLDAYVMLYLMLVFGNADNLLLLGLGLLIMGSYAISVCVIVLKVLLNISDERYGRAIALLAFPLVIHWTIYVLAVFYWQIG